MYKGQFDFTNFSTQIHDFNPGIFPFPSGLFWTVRIPSDAVSVHLGSGSASLSVSDQRVRDFHNILNSLANGSSDSASVSYNIHWHGIHSQRHVRNATLHTSGLYVQTGASIEWTGHNRTTGFTFKSHAEGQKVISAQLVQLRNGVFF